MSRTIRKDRNDKRYKESLKKKEARYKCRCGYCTGVVQQLNKNTTENTMFRKSS
jgi:hypothetical protein